MHVANLLDVEKFEVAIDGRVGVVSDVFPEFHRYDRFGIVIHDDFGALGAGLLIQAVTAEMFRVRRAQGMPDIYPEIYAFHVGRDHCDLSMFDFWPRHKEVVVDDEPAAIVQAINARGITRLAVPEGDVRPFEFIWPERAAAVDRISTVVAYSPGGHAADSDVKIRSLSPDLEFNPEKVFDVRDYALSLANDDATPDVRRFIGHAWARQFAVPDAAREAAEARFLANRIDGLTMESYRRADVEYALGRLVR
ncbi:hypothetical protein [Nocardioides sambongensis]|uniref:hypothetical protein n=1 Tax=Nocardioides sambongensis TaxID=2589074 RepID=UPI00112A184B|nr:hypothetical protein [Nocardioides sambongensis]